MRVRVEIYINQKWHDITAGVRNNSIEITEGVISNSGKSIMNTMSFELTGMSLLLIDSVSLSQYLFSSDNLILCRALDIDKPTICSHALDSVYWSTHEILFIGGMRNLSSLQMNLHKNSSSKIEVGCMSELLKKKSQGRYHTNVTGWNTEKKLCGADGMVEELISNINRELEYPLLFSSNNNSMVPTMLEIEEGDIILDALDAWLLQYGLVLTAKPNGELILIQTTSPKSQGEIVDSDIIDDVKLKRKETKYGELILSYGLAEGKSVVKKTEIFNVPLQDANTDTTIKYSGAHALYALNIDDGKKLLNGITLSSIVVTVYYTYKNKKLTTQSGNRSSALLNISLPTKLSGYSPSHSGSTSHTIVLDDGEDGQKQSCTVTISWDVEFEHIMMKDGVLQVEGNSNISITPDNKEILEIDSSNTKIILQSVGSYVGKKTPAEPESESLYFNKGDIHEKKEIKSYTLTNPKYYREVLKNVYDRYNTSMYFKSHTNYQVGAAYTVNKKDIYAIVLCSKKTTDLLWEKVQIYKYEFLVIHDLRFRKTNEDKGGYMVLPIGYVYTQYPHQLSPVELGLYGTWDDISSEYADAFFRAEGANNTTSQDPDKTENDIDRDVGAQPFENQEAPQPDGGRRVQAYVWHPDGGRVADYRGAFFDPDDRGSYAAGHGAQIRSGNYGGVVGFDNSRELGIDRTAAEFRPKNFTIRLWKRVM